MRYIIATCTLSLLLAWSPAWAGGERLVEDVPSTSWMYAAVDYLEQFGILTSIGYPPGFFTGKGELTRYEFMQATVRIVDIVYSNPEAYPAHVTAMATDLLAEFTEDLNMLSILYAEERIDPRDTSRNEVPPEDWAWDARKQLIACGLYDRSSTAYTYHAYTNERRDFAYMTAVAAARAAQRNDRSADAIIDRLYFELRDCLRICALAPVSRQPEEFTKEPLNVDPSPNEPTP